MKVEELHKLFKDGMLFPTCRDRSADFSEIFGPGVRVLFIGAATRRPFGRQTRLGVLKKERDDSDIDKFKFGATWPSMALLPEGSFDIHTIFKFSSLLVTLSSLFPLSVFPKSL